MKFKLFLNVVIFQFYMLFSFAQFSGKITYHLDYQTAENETIEEVLNQPKIDSIHYFVNAKTYHSKSFSKGEVVEEYVYDAASKKMLFSMGNRPYYLYLQTDLQKFNSPLQIMVESSKTERILGYEAYRTVNQKTREVNYYSKDLQIDYANFADHHFMQWNQLLHQVEGSIPLKSSKRYPGYIETKTAVKVEPMTPSEMNFEIDSSKMQVAAYDNLDEVIDFPELKGSSFWCYQAQVESKSSQLIDGKDYQLLLRFVIHPDQSITHIEIEESEYDYLNETAKRIIETCDLGFEPGKINGEWVSSEIYYPINF